MASLGLAWRGLVGHVTVGPGPVRLGLERRGSPPAWPWHGAGPARRGWATGATRLPFGATWRALVWRGAFGGVRRGEVWSGFPTRLPFLSSPPFSAGTTRKEQHEAHV